MLFNFYLFGAFPLFVILFGWNILSRNKTNIDLPIVLLITIVSLVPVLREVLALYILCGLDDVILFKAKK